MNLPKIVISRLKPNTQVLLETKESVFDITVVNPEVGEVLIFGGKRFVKPTKAIIKGAFGALEEKKDSEALAFPGEIAKGYGVEILYDSQGTEHDFVTSGVLSAKISGKGTGVKVKGAEGEIVENWEDWDYELWDSNEKENALHASLEEAKGRFK